jgi:hypothetical protein
MNPMKNNTSPNGSILVFLPCIIKRAGWLLVVLATVMLAAYFLMDFRFQMPVFALFSAFFETKFLVTFRTNFADELIMISYLAGFFMVVFSRERTESEDLDRMRARAMFLAIQYNFIFLAFSVLFVFGTGFIGALLLNMVTPLIIYLVVFSRLRKRQVK